MTNAVGIVATCLSSGVAIGYMIGTAHMKWYMLREVPRHCQHDFVGDKPNRVCMKCSAWETPGYRSAVVPMDDREPAPFPINREGKQWNA